MCQGGAPTLQAVALFPFCNGAMTLARKFTLSHEGRMQIYKILRADEWAALTQTGATDGAPIDVADGFIHFSTAEQVRETAAKHFADQSDLLIAAFDADALGDALKWDVSRGGALFPHLYAPLRLVDVLWHKPLPWTGTAHDFPNEVPE